MDIPPSILDTVKPRCRNEIIATIRRVVARKLGYDDAFTRLCERFDLDGGRVHSRNRVKWTTELSRARLTNGPGGAAADGAAVNTETVRDLVYDPYKVAAAFVDKSHAGMW
jgi:hypothetical protein